MYPITPNTITTKSFEFNWDTKAAFAFKMKYPITAEAPDMNTFPINIKIEPKEVSRPNYIGLVMNSFIESMQETQKFFDDKAT
jgi:hypothetical protein